MTVESVSNSTFSANDDDITGVNNFITGEFNQIHGNNNSVTGDNNQIYGNNISTNGVGNSIYDSSGGKISIAGSVSGAFVSKSTNINLEGHGEFVEFTQLNHAHSNVHGFITGGIDKDSIYTNDYNKVSFSYHGNDTLMSLDRKNHHADVLFTGAHVTSDNVIKLNPLEGLE